MTQLMWEFALRGMAETELTVPEPPISCDARIGDCVASLRLLPSPDDPLADDGAGGMVAQLELRSLTSETSEPGRAPDRESEELSRPGDADHGSKSAPSRATDLIAGVGLEALLDCHGQREFLW